MNAARRHLALAVALAIALAAFGTGCTSDAQKRDRHMAEAERLIEDGRLREGLIELRSALRLDPQNPEINFRLAEGLKRGERVQDAIFFYRETQRLDPGRLDAPVREAELLMYDEPDTAAELIDEVIEREPSYADAYLVRSKIALVNGEPAPALSAALTALELAPDDPAIHQQIGKVHQARIRAAALENEQADDAVYEAALKAYADASAASDASYNWIALGERARIYAAWPGHLEEAKAAYREAVRAAAESGDPAAVRASTGGAVGFAREVDDAELLRLSLEVLVEEVPDTYWAWSSLAAMEEKAGRDPFAVFDRMLEALPDDRQAHLRYARELADRDRLEEAVAHLEKSARGEDEAAEYLGAMANLLRAHGKPDEASEVVARLEREYPDHPRTLLARGQQALDENRLGDAIRELRVLTGRVPLAAAWHLLAVAEYRTGDRRAALDAVDQAIDLGQGGDLEPAFRLRARLQSELGDCTGALRSFTTLVRNGAELTPVQRVLQAKCLYEIGRPDLGFNLLARLLQEPDPPVQVALQLARREWERRPELVKRELERAANAHPGDAAVLTELARIDLREERPKQALARLNEAVETGQATPALLLQRARVLATVGEVEAAQRDGLQAFEAQPNLPGATAFLVGLYAAQGREQEVIQSFEEAHAVGALRPPAQFLLAQLHLRAGNAERARELLEVVTRERADLPQAKNDLAYLLARSGEDLERAQQLAQEAAQGLGDRPAVADTLGFVYLQRGLHGPALDQFDRALELTGEENELSPVFHYHRGLALRGLDRRDEAAAAFEKALSLDAGLEEAAQALEGLRAEAGGAAAPSSS